MRRRLSDAAGASVALLQLGGFQVVARALASTGGERSEFSRLSKDEPLFRVLEADLIYSRIVSSVYPRQYIRLYIGGI